MAVPPDPVLRAAVRWLEHLPASGAARCRALFTSHRGYSDLTPTQYEAAYAWLGQTGLLEAVGSGVPAERKVFAAAISGSTSWFPDTDLLVTGPDDLPADALRAAEALGLDESSAYSELAAAWGKVDTARREEVGAAGEEALVALLRASACEPVEHVAAYGDGYGYDIRVGSRPRELHLEVKSTTRRGRFSIHLSRNEYEVMRRDPLWQLVAVRLTDELEAAAVAVLPSEWIARQAPTDRTASGRWESCALEVPHDRLETGIAALAPLLTGRASKLLAPDGPGWPG